MAQERAVEQVEMGSELVGSPVAVKDLELGSPMEPEKAAPEGDDREYCLCLSWEPCEPRMKSCCGVPSDPRPNLSVWDPEDRLVLRIPAFFAVVGSLGCALYLLDPVRFHVLRPPENLSGLFLGSFVNLYQHILYIPLGTCVWYCGVPVAFTRKAGHLYWNLLAPFLLGGGGQQGPAEGMARAWYVSIVWNTLSVSLASSIQYLQPVRRYVWPLKMSFAQHDRSEDRPYTNLWMMLQMTAVTLIKMPMYAYLGNLNKPLLAVIPFLALGLGDGLAEPVGKICGKHKYETTALFTDKKFTRSYEGSACVFFSALLGVFLASSEMNWAQLFVCVLILPIANTLAEARSPHTFDNHFIDGTNFLLLWLIFDVLPLE